MCVLLSLCVYVCGWMWVSGVGAAGGEILIMAACVCLFRFYFLTPAGPRGQTRSDGIISGSAGLIKAGGERLDRQRRKGQKDLKRIQPCNKNRFKIYRL